MQENIILDENAKVYIALQDIGKSQVGRYLKELKRTKPLLYKKTINAIAKLPIAHVNFINVKHLEHKGIKFYQLKVQSQSNISRFFYKLEAPNTLVIYGFTKKTQQTDIRDLDYGINLFQIYEENKLKIIYE